MKYRNRESDYNALSTCYIDNVSTRHSPPDNVLEGNMSTVPPYPSDTTVDHYNFLRSYTYTLNVMKYRNRESDYNTLST